jgi:beta-exotoxin I transport system ATP-binding protein
VAPAIRTEGLTKYYGAVVGVEDLRLEVERGEIFGFLGSNGAGKTTTIRLLLDLLRPSRGTAAVMGIDCHRASVEARRQIGYLPGELPIYPDLTAEGYLSFLASLDGRRVDPAYLAALLERFDVSSVDARRRLRDQSHGMKQKIGIIQALMFQPPVVILDEPTSGLDPLMVQAFRETLADLKRAGRATVFLSSHVLAEVEGTCDRIGLIRGGTLVAVNTIDELRAKSPRRVTIRFARPVAAPPPIERAAIVEASPQRWIVDVSGPIGPLVAAVSGLPVDDLDVDAFKLEDYVLALYAPADGTRH